MVLNIIKSCKKKRVVYRNSLKGEKDNTHKRKGRKPRKKQGGKAGKNNETKWSACNRKRNDWGKKELSQEKKRQR